jgi:hypothetical protein
MYYEISKCSVVLNKKNITLKGFMLNLYNHAGKLQQSQQYETLEGIYDYCKTTPIKIANTDKFPNPKWEKDPNIPF